MFHQVRQAKFAYGGFSLETIFATAPTTLAIKVVKIDSNLIILLPRSKSVKQTVVLWQNVSTANHKVKQFQVKPLTNEWFPYNYNQTRL